MAESCQGPVSAQEIQPEYQKICGVCDMVDVMQRYMERRVNIYARRKNHNRNVWGFGLMNSELR